MNDKSVESRGMGAPMEDDGLSGVTGGRGPSRPKDRVVLLPGHCPICDQLFYDNQDTCPDCKVKLERLDRAVSL